MVKNPVDVTIIGAPVACKEGVKDLWRDVATWADGQLKLRYGSRVTTRYYDFFDPGSPPIPDGGQLPLVMVNQEVVSSGGKISLPLIRKKIEALVDEEN